MLGFYPDCPPEAGIFFARSNGREYFLQFFMLLKYLYPLQFDLPRRSAFILLDIPQSIRKVYFFISELFIYSIVFSGEAMEGKSNQSLYFFTI